jgi:hypothetical protein
MDITKKMNANSALSIQELPPHLQHLQHHHNIQQQQLRLQEAEQFIPLLPPSILATPVHAWTKKAQ